MRDIEPLVGTSISFALRVNAKGDNGLAQETLKSALSIKKQYKPIEEALLLNARGDNSGAQKILQEVSGIRSL